MNAMTEELGKTLRDYFSAKHKLADTLHKIKGKVFVMKGKEYKVGDFYRYRTSDTIYMTVSPVKYFLVPWETRIELIPFMDMLLNGEVVFNES
jgi:hypothetical protein|nr:MAG TPA: hypothetical protein [Caudoviricetes sp.]